MFAKREFESIESVKEFIFQRRINAFHPDNREHVAVVEYDPSGACSLEFADGRSDIGSWGFTDQGYWTSYRNFRDGERHEFLLQLIAPQIMQAFHANGTRAFLQSAFSESPPKFDGE
jgi:hypothetical protein